MSTEESKHSMQLTSKAFVSQLAGRRDDQLEFIKYVVDIVRQLPDSLPPA